jgi:DNA modification methylase
LKPYYHDETVTLFHGNALDVLRELPEGSARCCVTSPPYWGLRDYSIPPSVWPDGWTGCHGLEPTIEMYVEHEVVIFREVRRVLTDDATLWVNLGDTYAAARSYQVPDNKHKDVGNKMGHCVPSGLKQKDLIGIPWRTALALQADGWYLRCDIIWCLSGGTTVYVRTQKGDMPMTLKDMARLDPSTVQLWNGERWTQLLGMSKSNRQATELTLVLRSGERISCTPTHRFPTARGLLEASQIKVGDCLFRTRLPEPDMPKSPEHISDDAAWFAGLYLAEGSMADDTIQISGHAKEIERWKRIQRVAAAYGGSATRTITGNSMNIRLYGKMLVGLVSEFVSGKIAINKHISPVVWRYGNKFLSEYIRGYLDGDGCWEEKNQRWRLGFCRNYALEQDLRTACSRLGWMLTLNPRMARYQNGVRPSFRGEVRIDRSGHHNERSRNDVVRIERARCRHVYGVGVEDNPHLFALSSGILTHNSKPNPMPESVRDRPTKSHEYIFLLSKSERYHYDFEAIKEPVTGSAHVRGDGINPKAKKTPSGWDTGPGNHNQLIGRYKAPGKNSRIHQDRDPAHMEARHQRQNESFSAAVCGLVDSRNKRSVWTVPTFANPNAHFATFPPNLIRPCILAGCPSGGTVIDPFSGSGTTALVAKEFGRKAIGIDMNTEYLDMTIKRTAQEVLPL